MSRSRETTYYNLGLMLDAGLPIVRALKLAPVGLRGKLPRGISRVAARVEHGIPLCEVLAEYPHTFTPLDTAVIEAGETSGDLPYAFKLLSRYYSLINRLKAKAISALMLPLGIVHAAALIAPLPAVFLGGFDFSGYLPSVIFLLLPFYIPTVMILAIIYLTPKRGLLRRMLDRATLKIPLLGSAVKQMSISRFFHAFHMLANAGVPPAQAVEKASLAAGNAVITERFIGGVDAAMSGRPVSDGFSNRLPRHIIEAWKIGEETGSLQEVSRRLADNTTELAELLFTNFAVWLPRVVYFAVMIFLIYLIFKTVGTIYGPML